MRFDELWQRLAEDLTASFPRYRRSLADLDIRTKADRTLLTEADVAVERLVVSRIRQFDHDAVIVAEEDGRSTVRAEVPDADRVWVVDPIDGTAEFVRPDRVEFCSVVCALEGGEPVASFVFAPELGRGREPIVIIADRAGCAVTVNGTVANGQQGATAGKWVSVTRSDGVPPRPFEIELKRAGYRLKTRTTSQTLDMVRTAIDLTPFTEHAVPRFELFARANQKVWDGLAGLCFGATLGLRDSDSTGNRRLPVSLDVLSAPEPTFDFTVMGLPEVVEWFLELT